MCGRASSSGETAAWGRAVGVWGNTDGDAHSPGSNFKVAGAIVGVDHVFTPILMAGLAAQWTTTDINFKARPDKAGIDSFEAGAYMSYGDTRLYLNANASVIFASCSRSASETITALAAIVGIGSVVRSEASPSSMT